MQRRIGTGEDGTTRRRGGYQNVGSYDSFVYSDIPITPRRTDDMRSVPSPESSDRLRAMRRLAYTSSALRDPQGALFLRQGMMMKDFCDGYTYTGEILAYSPTYQTLTDEQLRGYFTWRQAVREGHVAASLTYARLYASELLCMIGPDSPQEAFDLLKRFACAYAEFDPRFTRLVQGWLIDFAAYYGLDPSVAADLPDLVYDRNILVLRSEDARFGEEGSPASGSDGNAPSQAPLSGSAKAIPGGGGSAKAIPGSDGSAKAIPGSDGSAASGNAAAHPGDVELFDALCALSSYDLRSSALMEARPQETRDTVCRAFRALCSYYRKSRHTALTDFCFGRIISCQAQMFRSAVFYSAEAHPDCEYRFNDIHIYRCSEGRWSCEKYYGNRTASTQLGDILKSIDSRLRNRYGIRPAIKQEISAKWMTAAIDQAAEQTEAWQKQLAASHIEIDLSLLSGIRRSADITRDMLIVEDDSARPDVSPGQTAAGSGAAQSVDASALSDASRGLGSEAAGLSNAPQHFGNESDAAQSSEAFGVGNAAQGLGSETSGMYKAAQGSGSEAFGVGNAAQGSGRTRMRLAPIERPRRSGLPSPSSSST